MCGRSGEGVLPFACHSPPGVDGLPPRLCDLHSNDLDRASVGNHPLRHRESQAGNAEIHQQGHWKAVCEHQRPQCSRGSNRAGRERNQARTGKVARGDEARPGLVQSVIRLAGFILEKPRLSRRTEDISIPYFMAYGRADPLERRQFRQRAVWSASTS